MRSQHRWPTLGFDIGRAFDFSHHLWPAGFYNKTFKWPNWHTWEGLVRRSAGWGRPPTGPDPDHYEHLNAHCDLLICGGGPAGLAAALAAGRAGARVILADQDRQLGGSLLWEHYELEGCSGSEWAEQTAAELSSMGNVMLLPRTTVTGNYDHMTTTLLQQSDGKAWRECLWTVRPRRILLATGAIEQTLIFPNNDRPGTMQASAVRHYLNRYAVAAGESIVVSCNNDSAYQTVFDLHRRGITVSAVVDVRPEINEELRHRITALGTDLLTAARISDTSGSRRIRSVSIESVNGASLGNRACDLLAVSGGWAPRIHLLAHARGELVFDDHSQSFRAGALPDGFAIAGSVAGTTGLLDTLAEGTAQASALCQDMGFKIGSVPLPRVDSDGCGTSAVAATEIMDSRKRQWIDLAHDVTMDDAELAVREGYVSVEHFKRYTTTGMSLDQGKTGNINAFIALAKLTDRSPGEVGTTTFRPPYMPITLGAIAGRDIGEFYAPRRYLPAHSAHLELNASFEDYGWQRPDCYPREGESFHDAVYREALAVRQHVGIFDNSPIGKIEVSGPDAAEFLNRFYINNALTLKVGKVRYGLMLNENGVIVDDGVFVRLEDERYLVHTTSAGVGRIVGDMEEWLQCEWPDLKVRVEDVTTSWGNFTIAGPDARHVLHALGTDVDISAESMPHMSAASGQIAGIEARIVRVSFSGELSFEVNIPARYSEAFWKAALEAGAEWKITPYGVEPLMLLRTEKGYLHVGSDTDGATHAGRCRLGTRCPQERNRLRRQTLLVPSGQHAGRAQTVCWPGNSGPATRGPPGRPPASW